MNNNHTPDKIHQIYIFLAAVYLQVPVGKLFYILTTKMLFFLFSYLLIPSVGKNFKISVGTAGKK